MKEFYFKNGYLVFLKYLLYNNLNKHINNHQNIPIYNLI